MSGQSPLKLNIEQGVVGMIFGSVLAQILLLGGMGVMALRKGVDEVILTEWLFPWLAATPMFAAAGWYSYSTNRYGFANSLVRIIIMAIPIYIACISIPTARTGRGDSTLIYPIEMAKFIVPPWIAGLIAMFCTRKPASSENEAAMRTLPDEPVS